MRSINGFNAFYFLFSQVLSVVFLFAIIVSILFLFFLQCALCSKPQFIRHTKTTRKTIPSDFFVYGRIHFANAAATATATIIVIDPDRGIVLTHFEHPTK